MFELPFSLHSLILPRLHRVIEIPLSELTSTPLTIKDNIWYNYVDKVSLEVSHTYPDQQQQAL